MGYIPIYIHSLFVFLLFIQFWTWCSNYLLFPACVSHSLLWFSPIPHEVVCYCYLVECEVSWQVCVCIKQNYDQVIIVVIISTDASMNVLLIFNSYIIYFFSDPFLYSFSPNFWGLVNHIPFPLQFFFCWDAVFINFHTKFI